MVDERKILVIGGAGYVGSSLVPALLKNYRVDVFDTFWYGDVFSTLNNSKLSKVKGDVRDKKHLREAMKGIDSVIHLACISNDPSFDLDPQLGRSINFDAFFNVVDAANAEGIRRLVYASSSSVYGVKNPEEKVTEESILEPITDYAKYKAACEEVLKEKASFEWTTVRPGTTCGYAPRVRLDVSVNHMAIEALETGKIQVGGGDQLRSNVHVKDMVRIYEKLLDADAAIIDRQIFNTGFENLPIRKMAERVRDALSREGDIEINFVPTDDTRSYHVNPDKIKRVLGFEPNYTIEDAAKEIEQAHREGKIIDGLNNPLHHNIKMMKELKISK